jgi:hypothetical protein
MYYVTVKELKRSGSRGTRWVKDINNNIYTLSSLFTFCLSEFFCFDPGFSPLALLVSGFLILLRRFLTLWLVPLSSSLSVAGLQPFCASRAIAMLRASPPALAACYCPFAPLPRLRFCRWDPLALSLNSLSRNVATTATNSLGGLATTSLQGFEPDVFVATPGDKPETSEGQAGMCGDRLVGEFLLCGRFRF